MIETPVAAARAPPLRSRATDSLAAVYRGRTLDSAVVRTLHPAVDRHQRGKTVTWSSDRRSNAKEFSRDRKVVKSQVAFFCSLIKFLFIIIYLLTNQN